MSDADLGALDIDVLEGTRSFAGICRACSRSCYLVRGVWCSRCGASLGLAEEP